mmetsp:Transcript_15252/g.57966  ORF Transcript_15252/g.57966 Transcript_15252/m.57966 type:complete len:241 (-) Transcript_15252:3532-4254(-)
MRRAADRFICTRVDVLYGSMRHMALGPGTPSASSMGQNCLVMPVMGSGYSRYASRLSHSPLMLEAMRRSDRGGELSSVSMATRTLTSISSTLRLIRRDACRASSMRMRLLNIWTTSSGVLAVNSGRTCTKRRADTVSATFGSSSVRSSSSKDCSRSRSAPVSPRTSLEWLIARRKMACGRGRFLAPGGGASPRSFSTPRYICTFLPTLSRRFRSKFSLRRLSSRSCGKVGRMSRRSGSST